MTTVNITFGQPMSSTPQPVRLLDLDSLSAEARSAIQGMLHYCIDHGVGMGQDEGRISKNVKKRFRREIEHFCDYTGSN